MTLSTRYEIYIIDLYERLRDDFQCAMLFEVASMSYHAELSVPCPPSMDAT